MFSAHATPRAIATRNLNFFINFIHPNSVYITGIVEDLQPQARRDEAVKLNKAIFEFNMEEKLREATQGELKDQADKMRNHHGVLAEALVNPFYDGDYVITTVKIEVAMTLPVDIQPYLSDTIKHQIQVGGLLKHGPIANFR